MRGRKCPVTILLFKFIYEKVIRVRIKKEINMIFYITKNIQLINL